VIPLRKQVQAKLISLGRQVGEHWNKLLITLEESNAKRIVALRGDRESEDLIPRRIDDESPR